MQRLLLSLALVTQVGIVTYVAHSLDRDDTIAQNLPASGDSLAQTVGVPLESDGGGVPPNPSLAQSPNAVEFVSMDPRQPLAYNQVLERTKAMVNDSTAVNLAQRHGLSILDLTWEDTGRYKNSAVGPNISDMTIQVQEFDPESDSYQLHLMPVIRFPNFDDRSADIPLDAFSLLVGNEQGRDLKKVSLRQVLGNLRDYLHEPDSWPGSRTSLLANDRDSHVLVSAQACFLPIPQGGTAEFNPVLFNYQSYAGNPAVLTILATREGTSATIIDNSRDAFEAGLTWGQRLFFNKDGERASLTGRRASDFLTEQAQATGSDQPLPPDLSAAAEKEGLNLVMLIQVPLKQRERQVRGGMVDGMALPAAAPMPMVVQESESFESDVEAAVIGHGEVEGPFTEIDGLAIERDPRFPIRVTVQFYKGTSNGVVSPADMEQIRDQIARVYDDADYVGSLVTAGATGRPTEYDGSKAEPPNWWRSFWNRQQPQSPDPASSQSKDLPAPSQPQADPKSGVDLWADP
ncbi:hypothetical protein [Prochlorothrix hollandica]|uniref:hypothetical protein n=1 Tax=Prochlorothrix hollandica TaxID=1223 RepID=UPI00034A3002|nr:hypothetical protein [Prochlorothrix hollandica]